MSDKETNVFDRKPIEYKLDEECVNCQWNKDPSNMGKPCWYKYCRPEYTGRVNYNK